MRKKIIVGNWKMNYTVSEAEDFVSSIKDKINVDFVDVAICPNFVSLYTISNVLEVDYCIVGHSERREIFKETSEMVNKKAKKLLENNIVPIVCVGETLEERESGKAYDVIEKELIESIEGILLDDMSKRVIIAYEPIWAIGTGKTASADDANKMCEHIRKVVEGKYGAKVAENIRILYGGSVKADNAKEILEKDNIDGALVGGASLKNDFVAIVNY